MKIPICISLLVILANAVYVRAAPLDEEIVPRRLNDVYDEKDAEDSFFEIPGQSEEEVALIRMMKEKFAEDSQVLEHVKSIVTKHWEELKKRNPGITAFPVKSDFHEKIKQLIPKFTQGGVGTNDVNVVLAKIEQAMGDKARHFGGHKFKNYYWIDWASSNAHQTDRNCRQSACWLKLVAVKHPHRNYKLELDATGELTGGISASDPNSRIFGEETKKLQKVLRIVHGIHKDIDLYNSSLSGEDVPALQKYVEVDEFGGDLYIPMWNYKSYVRFFFTLSMRDPQRYLGVNLPLRPFSGNTYMNEPLEDWTWNHNSDNSKPIGSKPIYAVDMHLDQRTPYNSKYSDHLAIVAEGLFRAHSELKRLSERHNVDEYHEVIPHVLAKDEAWSGRRWKSKFKLEPSWLFHSNAPVCGQLKMCGTKENEEDIGTV